MKIDKERLLSSLLHNFYYFVLRQYDKHPREYSKGYRAGMLKVIDKVNSYQNEDE